MKNEKIKVMPVRKKHTHLTATLSLPLRLHERAWILTGSHERAWIITGARSLSTSLVQQILEVSQDGVVFETENTVYHLTYARRPAEIEVMCA